MNDSDDAIQMTDFLHQLWLIYSQLKDAESDSDRRLDLLERSRERLGKVLNHLYKHYDLIEATDRDKTELAPGLANRQA